MSHSKKITSIAGLHTLEKEIHSLLGSYKHTQKEYTDMLVSQKENQKTKSKLDTLNNMNATIVSLVNESKNKINQLYKGGIKNQHLVTRDNVKLNNIIQTMRIEDNRLKKLLRRLRSAEGENSNATLQQRSAYYQYVMFAILFIVVIALTIKTFAVSSSGYMETIILVLAIALILYHAGYMVF